MSGAGKALFATPLARALRKVFRNTPRAERRLKLVETLALGGKRYLALVECDGRAFLVGGKTDAVLSISPTAEPAAALPGSETAPSAALRVASQQDETSVQRSEKRSAETADASDASAKSESPKAADPERLEPGGRVLQMLRGTVTFRVVRAGRRTGTAALQSPAASQEPAPRPFRDVIAAYAGGGSTQEFFDDREVTHDAVVPPAQEADELFQPHSDGSLERELVAWAAQQLRANAAPDAAA